jgi:NitT/TauT family transport system ATP-binding protein
MKAMLTIEKLDFQYQQETPLFQGFNWEAHQGEIWTILGPSGCGKTTLLYLLAGLLKPARGKILIHSEQLERPRPKTGLILQDFGLLPWATVRQNASLGLQIRTFYGPDGLHAPSDKGPQPSTENVQRWIRRLKLSTVSESYPGQLSGGQRQRTAIARTLVLNPDLLLMDEPFASLDAPTREDLQDLILDLRQEQGITVVAVTHTIEEAVYLGDKILLLSQPPNREAQVLTNPGAGNQDYRGSVTFQQVCKQLRGLMGESE